MKPLNRFFDEQMKAAEFRSEYEDLQPEFDIIIAIVEARNSQHSLNKIT